VGVRAGAYSNVFLFRLGQPYKLCAVAEMLIGCLGATAAANDMTGMVLQATGLAAVAAAMSKKNKLNVAI
jgi:hypothetical protein